MIMQILMVRSKMMMIATQVREGEDHTLEPDGVPGDLKNCSGIFHLFHRSWFVISDHHCFIWDRVWLDSIDAIGEIKWPLALGMDGYIFASKLWSNFWLQTLKRQCVWGSYRILADFPAVSSVFVYWHHWQLNWYALIISFHHHLWLSYHIRFYKYISDVCVGLPWYGSHIHLHICPRHISW